MDTAPRQPSGESPRYSRTIAVHVAEPTDVDTWSPDNALNWRLRATGDGVTSDANVIPEQRWDGPITKSRLRSIFPAKDRRSAATDPGTAMALKGGGVDGVWPTRYGCIRERWVDGGRGGPLAFVTTI
jgi:hypothetical protein